jgi:hypothetical protein
MDSRFEQPLQEVLDLRMGFGHREHLLLAWTYLQLGDLDTAQQWMCQAVRHTASSHGTPEKYHETLTIAWTRIVAAHTRAGDRPTFDEFLIENPHLLDRHLPELHFSKELLWSEHARRSWAEPDIQAIP